jgi:hypothetical protein
VAIAMLVVVLHKPEPAMRWLDVIERLRANLARRDRDVPDR